VLRLVSLGEPAPFAPALLEEWAQSMSAHAHALQWLLDLSILEHAAAQPGMLRLNPVYCEQLGELLRGVTVTGNAFEVLSSVDGVSDTLRWDLGSGHCGKGQPAKVDAGGPHLRCVATLAGGG
jgi:hypothetical protein